MSFSFMEETAQMETKILEFYSCEPEIRKVNHLSSSAMGVDNAVARSPTSISYVNPITAVRSLIFGHFLFGCLLFFHILKNLEFRKS